VANVSVVVGLLLTGVGLYGYFGTGTASPTALIPAGLGVPLVVLGLAAYKDRLRMHAMHAAVIVGLIGFLACVVVAAPSLPALVRDGKVIKTNREGVERDATAAVVSQTVTAVLCGVFVALCVNSFVQARRARRANAVASSPTGTTP
jgi:hypothetical protein